MVVLHRLLYKSPVGLLTLLGTEDALVHIYFSEVWGDAEGPVPVLEQTAQELGEYFAGQRREFTVPLAPKGTAFQQKVWAALREIPYGTTASYKDIAVRVGKPGGAIAVGQANSWNPIPIIIPCHRVIGSNGKMVGYTGGLHIKEKLLALERDCPEYPVL